MKKVIKVIGIFVCMIILVLNVSINSKKGTGNIDLSKLIVANQAYAECVSSPYTNQGRCSQLSDECFFDPWVTQCDWTLGK